MGEARRRAAMAAAETERRREWEGSLSEVQRIILRIAERTERALCLDGACYRKALFLKYHLEHRHGIQTEAVVGFVNDGTNGLYHSHAWLETDGLRTDIALHRPEDPLEQKRGPLTILGREMASGWPYTYHRRRPPEAEAAMLELALDPVRGRSVGDHEELHIRMYSTARSDMLIRPYLDGAPDGLDYERLAAIVET